MKTVFLYAVFALFLFFVNGILGRIQYGYREHLFAYGKFSFESDNGENFAGNFFLKIVNPAIYLALLCAILQQVKAEALCRSSWMVIPLYWGIRFLHIAAKNLFLFVNWRYELFSLCLSLLLGEGTFFLLLPLLNANASIFIPVDELRNAIWFAIIAYLAKVIWDISKTLYYAIGDYNHDSSYVQEVSAIYDQLSELISTDELIDHTSI